MVRSIIGEVEKKKPIISLLNPQLDLFDGLYKSPTSASSDQDKFVHARQFDQSQTLQSRDSMSDDSSEDSIPLVKANDSPQQSCCSSDLSEFENLKLIEKQIFKTGDKEKVPDYLKEDHPPIEGEPCREYLAKLTKWGERPAADSFMKIAN